MTENEAKQWLKHTRAYQYKCDNCECIDINGACNEECKDFYDMAIQALEEIQAYRAIGTPTQIYEKIGGLDVELGKYHSIGTVEEFKALKEKSTPKELDEHNFQDEPHHYLCPSCKSIVSCNQNFCEECGQALET